KAVPNPFYLTSGYDPNPGSYAIKFHHLPEACTIRIYNLAGELVRTLEKDDPATAIAEWDILTENGLPVASGIYIYVVDAEGFGQKIGKMAVFVEKEVLDIY
ncbi:MAG: T9SS type A sorting domain-containing protein, partial [Candidatus Zixiibacteriota bacterium]